MDVHTQTKEQEIFPAWIILLQLLCPETRKGWHQISQRRKGGLAGMMLHQVSPAAPSLTLTSWGSRQWIWCLSPNQCLLEWDVSSSAYTKL